MSLDKIVTNKMVPRPNPSNGNPQGAMFTTEQFQVEYNRFKNVDSRVLKMIKKKFSLQPTWKISTEQEARLAAARQLLKEREDVRQHP